MFERQGRCGGGPGGRPLDVHFRLSTHPRSPTRASAAASLDRALGLWRGDERMPVVHGNAQPDGRALAITINTGVQVRVPELDVPHASGAITVDGQLNEPAWRTAPGPLLRYL